MQLLIELYNSVYLNFFVFGMTLASIFTLLVGLFLILLPGRSKSTGRLAMVFLILALFNLSYVFGSIFYHPFAAFHRWGTVFLIFPIFIFYTQWIFHFPEDTHKNARRFFLVSMWLVTILITGYFYYISLQSTNKYHFAGHYWDFDAEGVSGTVANLILLYTLIFVLVAAWKVKTLKTKERWGILKMTIGILISVLIPATLNKISRDGAIDRGIFLTAFVFFTILGFFVVVLVYFNNTHDKTTFMAKLVGISLVTFLLVMQGLGFVSMRDSEEQYDILHTEMMERAIEGGKRNSEIEYILELNHSTTELEKIDYKEDFNLYLPLIKIDMMNTAIFERIARVNEETFKEDVFFILENSPTHFNGYKNSIRNFLEKSILTGLELKQATVNYMTGLNKIAFIHTNKISALPNDNLCGSLEKYFEKTLKKDAEFYNVISKNLSECKWKGKELSSEELKFEIYKYIRFFTPAGERKYRKSIDGDKHFIIYSKFFPFENNVKEVGFSYIAYRKFMHEFAKEQFIILFIVLVVLLVVFPYFFQGSLVKPLNDLLKGVTKVNNGDLDVEVPMKVNDEIGFISTSFNGMVLSIKDARQELQDYANNLEEKVNERTKELKEKMEEVQKLKVQQDGDYFLTSLLAKPLFFDANKSDLVKTEFIIKQKKQFQFRNKNADLGGDICITGNLKLGTPENFKRYTMVMNGDAMGKSMQGAGGSLVMGVVMNSIMARSASNKRILDETPEKWLTDTYFEVNSVFKTFNGTMVLSAVVALIEDATGKMFYWNAEHPFSVLYRDEKASFIESALNLRKLGLESEYEFQVFQFQLEPGDRVILGSDGRDDIDLTPNEPIRTINDDEYLFLNVVEEAKGDIHLFEGILKLKGDLTDDLSFLAIKFQEDRVGMGPLIDDSLKNSNSIANSSDLRSPELVTELNKIYNESKKLYLNGHIDAARDKMEEAYSMEKNLPKLNKLYGLLCFKTRDYEKAIQILESLTTLTAPDEEILYYLSVSYKKLSNYQNALNYAQKCLELDMASPNHLVNISDLYRLINEFEKAKLFAEKCLEIEPDNKNAKKILSLISA
jgi:tetratricopeptide (TPR) repeat protein/HAMP domain-containing protein